MRGSIKYLVVVGLVVLLIGVWFSSQKCPSSTIAITDQGFQPDTVTITPCTTVTFVNQTSDARWPASDIHPTHGIYPEFDPLEGIAPGQNWSFTFDKEGNWKFHDHLFPQFTGVIRVQRG